MDIVKIRATFQDKRWQYLAVILDTRLLLIVFFAVILALPFLGITEYGFLDRNLLKAGMHIQGALNINNNGNSASVLLWLMQLHLALMFSLLVYLLILPFIPLVVSTAISIFFALALVLAQQITFIWYQVWIPISLWLLFLAVGHLMVFLWCVRRSFYITTKISTATSKNYSASAPIKKSFWDFLGLAQQKNKVRVAPTIMGEKYSEDFEDTLNFQDARNFQDEKTLPQTKPINRYAAASVGIANGARQFLGRYRIERELGRGAMGVVYLGFDPKISRKVAIKTLHYNQFETDSLPAVKERFFREAAAAGKLRHPNIVTIYDAGEESDLAYIAMDYVEGDSLSAHIRKDQLLEVELVYYIMALVSDAVNDANSQGIIHRDIKPSNILYDSKTNEVKVADFGIARIMDGSATRTKTGELVGSPLYMSPEQIKGETVGKQSDIFSLGVTFYQLLTGELPFKGDSLANLSYQIVQCKFKPVDEVRPGLPDSARRIIAKALQKNPDNRFETAAEMHDALQRAYSRDFPRA